jgi:DNA polymerase III epsilon subunit-like protein
MDGDLLRYNKNVTYSFLDCETLNLNLNFAFNRPWQIAVINCKGGEIVQKKDVRIDWSKVAPKLKIGIEAARVTHFDPVHHASLAVSPEEGFTMFWDDLKKTDYIIMHNGLRFDLYLLRGYAEYMGVDWKFIVNKIIDTKSIAQGIKLGIPYSPKQGNFLEYQYRMSNSFVRGIKTSLITLAKEYGIQFEEEKLHDALYDLEINKLVWDKLKYQIEL